jgi:hypothetical protein
MRTLRIFFYVLAVLAAGDVLTTWWSLGHGGAEANAAMQGVVQHTWLFIGTKVLWLVLGYPMMVFVRRTALRNGKSLAWVYGPLLGCVALNGYVLLNNVSVIRSLT